MRVGLGELGLGLRPLELKLGNPLDRRPREERAVPDQPQRFFLCNSLLQGLDLR